MISETKIRRIKLSLASLFLISVFVPVFVNAAEAPQPTGSNGTGITYECCSESGSVGADGKKTIVYGNCEFNYLILATKKIINWGVTFALSFSIVVVAYAGALYMISGDYPAKRKEANEMLRKVAIGIVFILAAWLIINLITTALLQSGYSNIITT